MQSQELIAQANRYLHLLCNEISNRRVGSQGNRQATDFFALTVASFGFEAKKQSFECIDWVSDGAELSAAGSTFQVFPSPYSLGGWCRGDLAVISNLEELAAADLAGKIALIKGDLAQGQLMPKRFPFYNPEEHQRIYGLLEQKRPMALLAATERNPELAGGVYPFPLFEDGDFDIPSVFMTAEEGARLAEFSGCEVSFASRTERIPAKGCNVVGRRVGTSGRRLVFCAHIDAKMGTPGAVDNAAGVVSLLLLAEILREYKGQLEVELVAINGEDYYAASGEIAYLQENRGRMDEIVVAVNIDGAGYIHGNTAHSCYGCSETICRAVQRVFAGQVGVVEGPPWYQSDHMIFVQNGVPAVALTTDRFADFQAVSHTEKDSPEMVDANKIVSLALALSDLPEAITTSPA